MSDTGEVLRSIPLFAGFDPADLDRIAAASTEESLADREILFRQGDQGREAFVVLEGGLEIVRETGEGEVLLAVRGPGDVVGEMALVDDAPRIATVRARGPVRLLAVPGTVLQGVLESSAAAARALSKALLTRWRETEARLRQREQLAQLGTLSAGVAHELNNPAAAARSAARGFAAAAGKLESAAAALAAGGSSAEAEDLARRLAAAPESHPAASERVSREESLFGRLRALGMERPGGLAGALAEADPEEVDAALAGIARLPDRRVARAVLELAVARREVTALTRAAEDATGRIADIVGAVRSYAFTGRAPVQQVDLSRMLDDTLLLLGSKLRGVELVREYGTVPPFPAYGSELNQVWTNLIDNAADAVRTAGRRPGRITLRTRVEGAEAVVEVEDDGTGIPADVLPRVFDAFFTTKPPGAGTGLGLEISYGVVVHRHGGDIAIDTEPGRTTVVVRLPLAGPA